MSLDLCDVTQLLLISKKLHSATHCETSKRRSGLQNSAKILPESWYSNRKNSNKSLSSHPASDLQGNRQKFISKCGRAPELGEAPLFGSRTVRLFLLIIFIYASFRMHIPSQFLRPMYSSFYRFPNDSYAVACLKFPAPHLASHLFHSSYLIMTHVTNNSWFEDRD